MKHVYLFLFLVPYVVSAQKSRWVKLLEHVPYDSNYVESYYDQHLHVTLISNSQNLYQNFKNASHNVSTTYRPNNVIRFGFGLDYNIFSMEYSHSIDLVDKPNPRNGNTESFNLRLGLTGRRMLASLIIQQYRGMYISNADELATAGIPLTSHVRKDMRTEMGFGVINYFFNHTKYSCMASLWQIDRQKKSAGSWVAGITSTYMHIGALGSIIQGNTLTDDERIKGNYNYMFGLNGGYACNLIFRKKWFFNLMLIPGLNLQYGYNINALDQMKGYGVKPGYHGDLRAIAGYNGTQWYFGLHSANYLVSNSIKDNVDVYLGYTYFRVFVGRRFHLPLAFLKP